MASLLKQPPRVGSSSLWAPATALSRGYATGSGGGPFNMSSTSLPDDVLHGAVLTCRFLLRVYQLQRGGPDGY